MAKDPYVYPGTVVLVNKLDVRDATSLQDIENSFYFAQLTKPLPLGRFNYKHLKDIHKHLFGDLYSLEQALNLDKIRKLPSTTVSNTIQ